MARKSGVSKSGRGPPQLLAAAASGDINTIRVAIQEKGDLNQADELGRTALYLAAREGRLEVVRLLLEAGASVDAACRLDLEAEAQDDRQQGGSLAEALERSKQVKRGRGWFEIRYPESATLDEEVRRGFQPKWTQHTPLHAAIRRRHKEVVQTLIQAGADVNARSYQVLCSLTPLMLAVGTRQPEMVRLLLESGADPNATDFDPSRSLEWLKPLARTALAYAAEQGSEDLVQLLEQAGAKQEGLNAFRLVGAARRGDASRVQALLAAGVPPHEPSPFLDHALLVAAKYGQAEAARLLAMADANGKRRELLAQALEKAVYYNRLAVVRALVEAGVTIHADELKDLKRKAKEEKYGEIGQLLDQVQVATHVRLIDALQARNWGQVRELARGKPPSEFLGPMLQAAEKGDLEMLQVLKEAGANLTKGGDLESGDSLLMIAAARGDLPMVKFLLDAGVDLHYHQHKTGDTALSRAADAGHAEVVGVLLAAGALKGEGASFAGEHALNAAIESGQLACVKALVQAGVPVTDESLECAAYAGQEAVHRYLTGLVSGGVSKGSPQRRAAGKRRKERREDTQATEFITAAALGDLKKVRKFIDAGIDVDVANERGETALHRAANGVLPLEKVLPVVNALLDAGADVNQRSEDAGVTPLLAAIQSEHEEVVRTLIAAGADVDAADRARKTPLKVAAEQGLPHMVKALVTAGANPRGKEPSTWVSAAWKALLVQVHSVMDFGDRLSQATSGKPAASEKKEKSLIPACLEALSDSDERVRTLAAQLLGRIGPPAKGAVGALRSTLQDTSRKVRKAVTEALDRIQSKHR